MDTPLEQELTVGPQGTTPRGVPSLVFSGLAVLSAVVLDLVAGVSQRLDRAFTIVGIISAGSLIVTVAAFLDYTGRGALRLALVLLALVWFGLLFSQPAPNAGIGGITLAILLLCGLVFSAILGVLLIVLGFARRRPG